MSTPPIAAPPEQGVAAKAPPSGAADNLDFEAIYRANIDGVTAALILSATTSAPPAYAVTTNPDGSVTVTLNDISALTGLNAELARDGIRAKAIPLTPTCPTRGFPGTMPAGTNPSTYTITIDPADIPAGYTAIVAASENASGQVELAAGARPTPGPACLNTKPLFIPQPR